MTDATAAEDDPLPRPPWWRNRRLQVTAATFTLLGIVALILAWPYRSQILDLLRDARASLELWLETLSPAGFALAYVVLSGIGAPIAAFFLTAGVYGWVGLAIIALGLPFSLTIGYYFATALGRPTVGWILTRFGYAIPRIDPKHQARFTLIVRVSGLPFFFQNLVLGVTHVRFWTYLIVSFFGQLPFAVAIYFLGKSLFQGNARYLLPGLGLLVIAAALTKVLRSRLQARRRAAAAETEAKDNAPA